MSKFLEELMERFLIDSATELLVNYSPSRVKELCEKYQLLGLNYSMNGVIYFDNIERFECEHSDTFKGFRGADHKNYTTEETFGPGWVNGFFMGLDGLTYKTYSCYTNHSIGGDRFSSIYHSTNLGKREFLEVPFKIGQNFSIGNDEIHIPVKIGKGEKVYNDSEEMFYELLARKTMKEQVLSKSKPQLVIVGKRINLTNKLCSDLREVFGDESAVFHEADYYDTYIYKYQTVRYFNREETVILEDWRYNDSECKYGKNRFYYSDMKMLDSFKNGAAVSLDWIFLNPPTWHRSSSSIPENSYSEIFRSKYEGGIHFIENCYTESSKKTSFDLWQYNVYFMGGYFALSKYGMSNLNGLFTNGYLENTRYTDSFYREWGFFKETFKNERNIIRHAEEFIRTVNLKQKYQILI